MWATDQSFQLGSFCTTLSNQDPSVPPARQPISSEQLDQLMQVVRPADWLALLTFGGLITVSLMWAIFGKVPIIAEGRAILLQPRQVVPLQAAVTGEIQKLHVNAGDCIQKHQLLATMTPTALLQELQFAQEKLGEVESRIQATQQVLAKYTLAEQGAIAANRASIEQNLQNAQALTPSLRDKTLASFAEQQRNLTLQLNNARLLIPIMEQRLADRRELQNQGAISNDTLLQVQQDYTKAQENVANLEVQLKSLAVTQAEAEQKYRENLNQVQSLQAQLEALKVRTTEIERQNLEVTTESNRQQQEIRREILRLNQQIASSREMFSTQSGCITELNTTTGQLIAVGMPLGFVRTDNQTENLKGMIYLAVRDGKRVQSGMKLTLTPDTVQRERFGGIVGTVKQVSSLPVTREGVLATVGNADLVQTLVGSQGAVIEIESELSSNRQNPSGYQWSSSKGPNTPITAGTTATVRITLEERPPITFVLPFLQALGDKQ